MSRESETTLLILGFLTLPSEATRQKLGLELLAFSSGVNVLLSGRLSYRGKTCPAFSQFVTSPFLRNFPLPSACNNLTVCIFHQRCDIFYPYNSTGLEFLTSLACFWTWRLACLWPQHWLWFYSTPLGKFSILSEEIHLGFGRSEFKVCLYLSGEI